MDDGYKIDEGTVRWARRRVDELTKAEVFIGSAIEKVDKLHEEIRAGADLMDNQPDSDMMRSFANDYERLTRELKITFQGMVSDRKAIQKGIREFENRED